MQSKLVSILPVDVSSSPHVLVTNHPYLTVFFLSLGALSFAKFLAKTLGVLAQTFVLPGKSLKKYGAGKGAWAVVTGASEGIGREFALQLAAKGFNVLVSARNASALASLTAEIESKSKVQTKTLVFDYSTQDEAQWARFRSEVEGLDVGVLINNVGRSHAYPVDFVDTPEPEMDSILKINVNSVAQVSRIVVPGMVQRRRGLVISIGSFSGISVVSPMLATYAGSKSFLASFSAALAEEVKGKGVDVECLNTYFVVSNLSKIRKPSLMIPTPKAYVRSVLAKVGLPCGALFTGRPHVVTPYWSHALLDWLMNVVGWKAFFASYTHNLHKSINKRALKKLAREAKQQ
ncbi:3-ketoacyl-CoA reductase [Panus rudis PR-1116 ss-1]|nr:3-ketoacyl-CoA reductase [Panus rudis PR-1116 ss-1]